MKILDQKLKKRFWVDLIYGSSVVEGVKLARGQVEEIVKLGNRSKLLKNNPSHELLQAYGQKVALERIEKWAKSRQPITMDLLQQLHYLVFESFDPKAGSFRDTYIRLRSSSLMPSFPFAIAADMRDFNNWLMGKQETLDKNNLEEIVNFIAQVYHQVTKIHPFSDGNGRTGRLFVNLLLRRFSLPYILVPKVENDRTIRKVLRAADMGDIKPLVKLQMKLLQNSFKLVENYWLKRGKSG